MTFSVCSVWMCSGSFLKPEAILPAQIPRGFPKKERFMKVTNPTIRNAHVPSFARQMQIVSCHVKCYGDLVQVT